MTRSRSRHSVTRPHPLIPLIAIPCTTHREPLGPRGSDARLDRGALVDPVVTGAVGAGAAVEQVAQAVARVEQVVAELAVERVGARAADQRVVALAGEDAIVAGARVDAVVAEASEDDVVARAGLEVVVAVAAL